MAYGCILVFRGLVGYESVMIYAWYLSLGCVIVSLVWTFVVMDLRMGLSYLGILGALRCTIPVLLLGRSWGGLPCRKSNRVMVRFRELSLLSLVIYWQRLSRMREVILVFADGSLAPKLATINLLLLWLSWLIPFIVCSVLLEGRINLVLNGILVFMNLFGAPCTYASSSLAVRRVRLCLQCVRYFGLHLIVR